MTRSLILGTAGHIDHGKTALVGALTGVDTDRLKEEKERGITIDLGFAEWAGEGVHLGIVDVPGHEGFIRNMVAGATGMDVVLLVVAADEGVMPQTREHLSIVSLLGVERLVVALTKVDLVEPAWLELVREEVRELLEGTPVADAEIVATSARTGRGLDELGAALIRVAGSTPEDEAGDVVRLPVDRVFTVHGTGTVVTGTLWSGTLRVGRKVALLPDGPEARIRGLQVHGRDVEEARAGHRTAVALAGADVERATIARGHTLVEAGGWPPTSMLTARLHLLPDTRWIVEHNQRVRAHLGTAEVMARVLLLGGEEAVAPGGEAWAQLRLESPVVARARERVVIRSYSPVTTIGGGTVVEPVAPKRTRLQEAEVPRMRALLQGSAAEAVDAALELAGWAGLERRLLPLVTGLPPTATDAALAEALEAGAFPVGDAVVSAGVAAEAARALEDAVDDHHRTHPLRPGQAVEALRGVLPGHAHPQLADAVLARLQASGAVTVDRGVVSRPDFAPRPDARQERVRQRLAETYRAAGLTPPSVDELPPDLRGDPDLWPLLKLLSDAGVLEPLTDDLFISSASLADAVGRVRDRLGGRIGLGPADFREALPVTRKHLMPLLGHLDRTGVTVRREEGREVPRP